MSGPSEDGRPGLQRHIVTSKYSVESKLMLTDTKVLWGRLEKRVFLLLFSLAGTEWCSGRLFTGSGFGLGRLVIETRR